MSYHTLNSILWESRELQCIEKKHVIGNFPVNLKLTSRVGIVESLIDRFVVVEVVVEIVRVVFTFFVNYLRRVALAHLVSHPINRLDRFLNKIFL